MPIRSNSWIRLSFRSDLRIRIRCGSLFLGRERDQLASSVNCSQTYLEPSRLSVGGNLNFSLRVFNGDIAEIIVYNQALTLTEEAAVENTLKTRYGIQ